MHHKTLNLYQVKEKVVTDDYLIEKMEEIIAKIEDYFDEKLANNPDEELKKLVREQKFQLIDFKRTVIRDGKRIFEVIYDNGSSDGYNEGHSEGYDEGYRDGFEEGKNEKNA